MNEQNKTLEVVNLINTTKEHFFFVFGPYQLLMVETFIKSYSIEKYKIYNVAGKIIVENGIKVNFNNVLKEIKKINQSICYIPHVNSIFTNIIFSDKLIILANIPDGVPNIIMSKPSINLVIRQIIKIIYCLLYHKTRIKMFTNNLIGYGYNRYSFAFSTNPELIWDKGLTVIPVPIPWKQIENKIKKNVNNNIAFIIGQPLEDLISVTQKIKIIRYLVEFCKVNLKVEKIYYILHPREKNETVFKDAEVKIKRLNKPVEFIYNRVKPEYCVGVSSFSLINIKLLNPNNKVYFHNSDKIKNSKNIKNIFLKIGVIEV
jgi:hypothetical protein